MSDDPIQVFAFGAKNLHLREHLDQGFKALEFHIIKDRKNASLAFYITLPDRF